MLPNSLSHNLTGKLIFSQKRVSKASNLIACCFWCFQMLLLMLSNYTFDALLQGQSIQSVEIERHSYAMRCKKLPTECSSNRNFIMLRSIGAMHKLHRLLLSFHSWWSDPARRATFYNRFFECHLTATCCKQYPFRG